MNGVNPPSWKPYPAAEQSSTAHHSPSETLFPAWIASCQVAGAPNAFSKLWIGKTTRTPLS